MNVQKMVHWIVKMTTVIIVKMMKRLIYQKVLFKVHDTYLFILNILFIYAMFYVDVDGLDEALLEMAYGGDKDDEYFEKFKKSISSIPEQIIRYFKTIYWIINYF